jgi:RNA polymerase sigma factor (sigma-70 family)
MARRPQADEAYTRFFVAQHHRVVASLTLAFGDEQLARDAAADAFAKALVSWERIAPMASPAGWVHRVAFNGARRQLRRRARERTLLARVPPTVAVGDTEPAPEVWAALARLPERQRTAAVLRWGADLTEAEIARIMGVRRSTVSATLTKARATLGRILPADIDGDVTTVGESHV